MRKRYGHKMGGWYPQIQGPSEIQDSQGERRQCGQVTQIVFRTPTALSLLTRDDFLLA